MSEEMKNGLAEEELEGCDCGCDCDDDCDCCYIELTDEDGNTEKYAIIDTIDYEDRTFVVLANENDPENVVFLEYIEEGEVGSFVSVEDEELLHKVFDMFVEGFENGCECDCDDDDCGDSCGCGCGHCH